ncbi:MAG TPA: cytochrome c-type biogenesis protein CcmH [Candidatus Eisenbacteria bacterium]
MIRNRSRRTVRGCFAAIVLGAALASLPPLAPPAGAAPMAGASTKDAARAITNGIICPCSCGEILTGCTCETGKAMRAYVEREVTGGKSKDQIEASLVAQYGEVILGAPKAKGFNLLVWVAPFVATAIGFLIATVILLRWARRRTAAPAGAPAPGAAGALPRTAGEDLASLRARAEAELRNMRE